MMNNYPNEPAYPSHTGYEHVQSYAAPPERSPAEVSAVSWSAVLAGAVAAAALSLILLVLGTGLGLSAVSPWTQQGMGAKALGIGTIVWLAVVQLLSSGLGGYLAGRLRTKWTDAARDEVFFRDTAHGFLSWAVATLLTAAVLTSAVSAVVGTGVQAGASLAGSAAVAAGGAAAAGGALATRATPGEAGRGMGASGAIDYLVDTLFRAPGDNSTPAASPPSTGDTATPSSTAQAPGAPVEAPRPTPAPTRPAAQDSAEVARIFLNADLSQPLPADDQRRVAQIVAERTGLSQA